MEAGLTVAELHTHVGIHDRDGPHQALQGHRPPPRQPEEDRKGHPESHRPRSDAQCAQTPACAEEEPADAVLVGGREMCTIIVFIPRILYFEK